MAKSRVIQKFHASQAEVAAAARRVVQRSGVNQGVTTDQVGVGFNPKTGAVAVQYNSFGTYQNVTDERAARFMDDLAEELGE